MAEASPKDAVPAAPAPSSARLRKPNPPSCITCRRRKIKCDRAHPCSNCVKSGEVCISPPPSHLPRGRQGGRRKQDADGSRISKTSRPERKDVERELLNRIAKLESLVQNMDKGGKDETAPASGANEMQMPEVAGTPHHEHKSSKQTTDRYLGGSLWEDLSAEIHGIREVLYHTSSEDEDDDDDYSVETPMSHNSTDSDPSAFAICSPMMYADRRALEHPNDTQRASLFAIFVTNVDLAIKVLHIPSLRRFMIDGQKQLDCSPGPRGLDALMFSIYYAATTSLTEQECLQRLGEDRTTLLRRFRHATETTLARADLLNTEEMSTLQALVFYMFALRSNESSRRTWTLVGLGVRIATALDLHLEEGGSKTSTSSPFDREMRRRLWWIICSLDRHASFDRGTDSIIGPDAFSTKLPLNINDDELDPASDAELKDREGYTDMTLSLLSHESFIAERRINFVPAGEKHKEGRPDEFDQRFNWSRQYQQLVERRYLRYCSEAIPMQKYTKLIGSIIISCFWLFTYRPFQRRANCPPIKIPDHGILHLSVQLINQYDAASRDPAFACYKWLANIWVQWYAMAVTLAELCTHPTGPLADEAWRAVDAVIDSVARNIADSQKGRLWRPLRKLANKAHAVREQHRDKAKDSDKNNSNKVSNDNNYYTLKHNSPITNSTTASAATTSSSVTVNDNNTSNDHSRNHSLKQIPNPNPLPDLPPPFSDSSTDAASQPRSEMPGLWYDVGSALNYDFGAAFANMPETDDALQPADDVGAKQQQQPFQPPGLQLMDTSLDSSFQPDLNHLAWSTWETFIEDSQSYDGFLPDVGSATIIDNPMVPYLKNW